MPVCKYLGFFIWCTNQHACPKVWQLPHSWHPGQSTYRSIHVNTAASDICYNFHPRNLFGVLNHIHKIVWLIWECRGGQVTLIRLTAHQTGVFDSLFMSYQLKYNKILLFFLIDKQCSEGTVQTPSIYSQKILG